MFCFVARSAYTLDQSFRKGGSRKKLIEALNEMGCRLKQLGNHFLYVFNRSLLSLIVLENAEKLSINLGFISEAGLEVGE